MNTQKNGLSLKPTYAARALDPDHRLRAVLASALKARASDTQPPADKTGYWGANHFGLEKTQLFQSLSKDKKNQLLAAASIQLLEEAYFIEKSGMSFTAKMALLSDTTEERMLYSLFSTDETLHLTYVAAHLPESPESKPIPPFVQFLSQIIQEGDRESLIFLIQVVLEGWGITHYHELAENCLSPELSHSLRLILKDEARHHGSGMILSQAASFSSKQKAYIRDVMIQFMQMVQCGPQSLVGAFESVTRPLTQKQSCALFEELGCEIRTQKKINALRSLLSQAGATDLINYLEAKGTLSPLSAYQCSQMRSSP